MNKRGQVIRPSQNFTARAFDIGGGPTLYLADIAEVIGDFVESNDYHDLIEYTKLERENNCFHILCKG